MRKRKIIAVIIVLFLASTSQVSENVYAATSASSAADQTLGQKLDEKINELKTKIASTVASLNLVEKRGIIGIISDVNSNQITLTDTEGNTRFVDVDEITKFSSPSAKGSFGLTDLTKGTRVRVLGTYNKDTKRILGRFIDVTVDPVFISGQITDIDKKNIMLTVTAEDQKRTVLDIQVVTKITSYAKGTDDTEKYGFSKLQIGDRVTAIGYREKQDPSIISVTRIIDFIDMSKNPKIPVSQPSSTQEVSPTISTKNSPK